MHAAVEMSSFGDCQLLVSDVAFNLGGAMQRNAYPANGTAHPAAYLNLLGADRPNHRALLGDQHLLAVDIASDVAVDLKFILRNDRDVLTEDGEVGADHRYAGRC